MEKNIFYFRNINKIGGIETFFYQLAKKYKDLDITIYYSRADLEQIKRLKKYVRVVQYHGEKIQCERAFLNYNLEIIDNIEAKEYIQIIHGDYKSMGLKPKTHEKITKYIGVSQTVCDSFKELTGLEAELVYNPIEIDKPKRVLNLISATRLTEDKGKNRIIKLAKVLDENKIPYIWTIFTDDVKEIDNPNIVYMKPRLDIVNYIANSDYLVQLSDAEGYCYSIVESLCLGVPVIVTDMPVIKELGVDENNGFILDFDLKEIPVKDIYEKKFNFKYIPRESLWEKYLAKGKSTYQELLKKKYEVEALELYEKENILDYELKRVPKPGEKFIISHERLEVLLGNNSHNKPFVKVIREIKNGGRKK